MRNCLVWLIGEGGRERVSIRNGSTDRSVEPALSGADRLPVRVVKARIGHGTQGTGVLCCTLAFRATGDHSWTPCGSPLPGGGEGGSWIDHSPDSLFPVLSL